MHLGPMDHQSETSWFHFGASTEFGLLADDRAGEDVRALSDLLLWLQETVCLRRSARILENTNDYILFFIQEALVTTLDLATAWNAWPGAGCRERPERPPFPATNQDEQEK
jgi:hypothetical protein